MGKSDPNEKEIKKVTTGIDSDHAYKLDEAAKGLGYTDPEAAKTFLDNLEVPYYAKHRQGRYYSGRHIVAKIDQNAIEQFYGRKKKNAGK